MRVIQVRHLPRVTSSRPYPDRYHTEEFGIYLNYVRKLGFEETPDYEFLRELFSKVMKNNGDIDDQVYDWNLLNGKDSFTFFYLIMASSCSLVHQVAKAGKQPSGKTSYFPNYRIRQAPRNKTAVGIQNVKFVMSDGEHLRLPDLTSFFRRRPLLSVIIQDSSSQDKFRAL